jgi:hypothetical protein
MKARETKANKSGGKNSLVVYGQIRFTSDEKMSFQRFGQKAHF